MLAIVIGLCPSSVMLRPSVIRKLFLKPHLLLSHWSKFKITSHEYSHYALYQNCINGFAPLNTMATRAPDKKSFKQHLLKHWCKFKIISQNCSSPYPLPKLHLWFLYAEQKGHKSSRGKISLTHWSKFKIKSQNCSS